MLLLIDLGFAHFVTNEAAADKDDNPLERKRDGVGGSADQRTTELSLISVP